MKLRKILNVILIFPAMLWSFNGINDLSKKGLSSYTFLTPFPFKFHTVSLLNIAIFYLVTFLIIKPHKPMKNFLISLSLLFLSNALYELVYAIFICNAFILAPSIDSLTPPPFGGIIIALPLVLSGIFLLRFLNRQYHFLTNDRNRIFLFLACFSSFIAAMFMLNNTGFFAEVYLYLNGQITNDPHNPLWILSKTFCVWMFFPLLGHYQEPEQTK